MTSSNLSQIRRQSSPFASLRHSHASRGFSWSFRALWQPDGERSWRALRPKNSTFPRAKAVHLTLRIRGMRRMASGRQILTSLRTSPTPNYTFLLAASARSSIGTLKSPGSRFTEDKRGVHPQRTASEHHPSQAQTKAIIAQPSPATNRQAKGRRGDASEKNLALLPDGGTTAPSRGDPRALSTDR